MIISRFKRLYEKYKKDIIFLFALVIGLLFAAFFVDAFLELREELKEKDLAPFDDSIAGFFHQLRSKELTQFFKTASIFGDQEFYFIATPILGVVIYLVYGKLRIALRLTLVLVAATLLTTVLKGFIERPRPKGEHLVDVTTYSFPSGHTVCSVAFYGFLIYIFWRSNLKRSFKITLTILLSIVILSIATSRIYLNVHYASDVIAGFLAGGFFLLIFILAFYISEFIKNNHNSSTGIK